MVRCFVLTHKKFVAKLAGDYLKAKNVKITQWLKDVKANSRADVLTLFILCIATDTHCFVHTKVGYWTTLLDDPKKHMEYVQQCSLHLSYLGNGSYAQHEICTETVAYEIFRLPEPLEVDVESQPIEIGTCTAEESETLDKLLRLGITTHSSSILKTAPGSGESTPTTSNTPSTLPTPPKPDSIDITPGKVDHKIAEPASTPTSEAAKLDIPSDVPSSSGVEAAPVSEKTGELNQWTQNVLQTKEIPSAKPNVSEPEPKPKNSDHSDLPPDDIPIPEEKDTAFDLDVTEGYSLDSDQDINTDPPGMSKTSESNQSDESTSIVKVLASYLEGFRSVIENQPKIQLKRLSAKDLPKKLAKCLKKEKPSKPHRQVNIFQVYRQHSDTSLNCPNMV